MKFMDKQIRGNHGNLNTFEVGGSLINFNWDSR